MRKIVLADATEFDVIRAIDTVIAGSGKKGFEMTFQGIALDQLQKAFTTPSALNAIQLFDDDGELIRVIGGYNLYGIQLQYNPEQIVVTLAEGDILQKEIDELKTKITNIEQDVPIEEDMDMMSLKELRAYKKKMLQSQCEKVIYDGAEVETSFGTEHFRYTAEDQRNIESLFNVALITNMPQPYHADGKVCTVYSADDIMRIYLALQKHKLYHTTMINAFNRYIEELTSVSELKPLSYPASVQSLPQSYQESAKTAIEQGNAVIDAFMKEKGLNEDAF